MKDKLYHCPVRNYWTQHCVFLQLPVVASFNILSVIRIGKWLCIWLNSIEFLHCPAGFMCSSFYYWLKKWAGILLLQKFKCVMSHKSNVPPHGQEIIFVSLVSSPSKKKRCSSSKCVYDPCTSRPSLLGWMRARTQWQKRTLSEPSPQILWESQRKRCQKVTFFFFVFTTGVSHWASSFQVAVSLPLGSCGVNYCPGYK